MNIHHIGYVVEEIQAATQEFALFGYHKETAGGIVYDVLRGIDIVFMTNGIYRVELVQPKDINSIAAGMLRRLGSAPYHICYECGDLEKEGNMLREKGYVPVSSEQPAVALGERKVSFWFHPQIGMVELLETVRFAGQDG